MWILPTLNFMNKINGKLKFLYRKNSFLTLDAYLVSNETSVLSCVNATSFWLYFFNLVSKPNKEIKTQDWNYQKKRRRFGLQLDKLKHNFNEAFVRLNSVPLSESFKQCVNSIVFQLFNVEYWMPWLSELSLWCPYWEQCSIKR